MRLTESRGLTLGDCYNTSISFEGKHREIALEVRPDVLQGPFHVTVLTYRLPHLCSSPTAWHNSGTRQKNSQSDVMGHARHSRFGQPRRWMIIRVASGIGGVGQQRQSSAGEGWYTYAHERESNVTKSRTFWLHLRGAALACALECPRLVPDETNVGAFMSASSGCGYVFMRRHVLGVATS